MHRTWIGSAFAALSVLALLSPTSLAAPASTTAAAESCVKRAESHADPNTGQSWNSVWYCGNTNGTDLYLGANDSTPVGWLDTSNSWFVCFRRGQRHSGGNDVWYYAQGDRAAPSFADRMAWGFVPAVRLKTSQDPWPGMPECRPDMWQVPESHKDLTGKTWNTVWYATAVAGAAVHSDPGTNTTADAEVAYLNSTTHWFACYSRGREHAGGNDVWYYTQGDRWATGQESRQGWGYVPAVSLGTRSDPYDGIPSCTGGSSPQAPERSSTERSYYVTAYDLTQAKQFGCDQAELDAVPAGTTPRNSTAILAFGGQNAQGTGTKLTFSYDLVTNSEIADYTRQFAQGYQTCRARLGKQTSVTVAMGINNDMTVTTATGKAWAGVVEEVDTWLASQGSDLRKAVSVVGADDLEPGFSLAADARAWVTGYLGATDRPLLNFGSADGCPVDLSTDVTRNQTCHNGWTWEDLWQISGGSPRILTVPEVYYATQARQWALIARYGEKVHQTSTEYHGVLTQYPLDKDTNTAAMAWEQLWSAMSHHGGPKHSMEICQSDLAVSGQCDWS